MITNALWSQKTKKIFIGILMYSLAGILYSVLEPIDQIMSTASNLAQYGGISSGFGGGLSIVCYILVLAIIAGYVLVFMGLTGFRDILEPEDAIAINKVRTGFILGIIAMGVDLIPLMGWVAIIINIVAYILMIIGYDALKKSPSFPELARKGANLLYIAAILLLAGAVLSFIPFVGSIIAGGLNFVAYIMTLIAWNRIVNAVPALPQNTQL